MSDDKRKPCPGDAGYQGGVTYTTIYVDGKAKRVRTVKDAYGNVTYVSVTDKIFGIF